jgi:hypothetical protein
MDVVIVPLAVGEVEQPAMTMDDHREVDGLIFLQSRHGSLEFDRRLGGLTELRQHFRVERPGVFRFGMALGVLPQQHASSRMITSFESLACERQQRVFAKVGKRERTRQELGEHGRGGQQDQVARTKRLATRESQANEPTRATHLRPSCAVFLVGYRRSNCVEVSERNDCAGQAIWSSASKRSISASVPTVMRSPSPNSP